MEKDILQTVANLTEREAVQILRRYDNTEFFQDTFKGCGCPITTDFTGLRVKNGEYTDCVFDGNNFQYTGAAGTHFRKCKFLSCKINGSNMQFCDFSNSTFCDNTEKTHLIQNTNFNQSCFYNSTFENVCIENTSVCQSQFLATRIENSFFRHTTLQDDIFRDADILHSSFIGCNLEYTDFINVRIMDSILPFHQIPYIYGGLQCISALENSVKVSSSMERAEILSAADYIKLLPVFVKYYEKECEYFPLANIALFRKEYSAAKKYINIGLKEYIRQREFRKLKSLCKLAVKNGNFAKSDLLNFYFDILNYFNSIELDQNERYQFGLHVDEIKNILFGISYTEKPHIEIILKTNITIEESEEFTQVISIIEDCLNYYHINNEDFTLELRHNSPPYSFWLAVCSLDPNLLVMILGMLHSIFSGDMSSVYQAIDVCANITGITAFIVGLADKKRESKSINSQQNLISNKEVAYAMSKHKLLKKKTKIEFSLGNAHFNYAKTKTYQ